MIEIYISVPRIMELLLWCFLLYTMKWMKFLVLLQMLSDRNIYIFNVYAEGQDQHSRVHIGRFWFPLRHSQIIWVWILIQISVNFYLDWWWRTYTQISISAGVVIQEKPLRICCFVCCLNDKSANSKPHFEFSQSSEHNIFIKRIFSYASVQLYNNFLTWSNESETNSVYFCWLRIHIDRPNSQI